MGSPAEALPYDSSSMIIIQGRIAGQKLRALSISTGPVQRDLQISASLMDA
jgi:hypothetical protein